MLEEIFKLKSCLNFHLILS